MNPAILMMPNPDNKPHVLGLLLDKEACHFVQMNEDGEHTQLNHNFNIENLIHPLMGFLNSGLNPMVFTIPYIDAADSFTFDLSTETAAEPDIDTLYVLLLARINGEQFLLFEIPMNAKEASDENIGWEVKKKIWEFVRDISNRILEVSDV